MTHERPVTKFEDKAHRVGSTINELIWGRSAMSLSEGTSGTDLDTRSADGGGRDVQEHKRVLLVSWDAPNLDMGLGAILVGRPTAAYPPVRRPGPVAALADGRALGHRDRHPRAPKPPSSPTSPQ